MLRGFQDDNYGEMEKMSQASAKDSRAGRGGAVPGETEAQEVKGVACLKKLRENLKRKEL